MMLIGLMLTVQGNKSMEANTIWESLFSQVI